MFKCAAAVTAALLMAANAYAGADAIRIGVIDDMTGPYAAVQGPGDFLAAKMAAEDFGGKVIGKPIEVLSGDHQNKTDVGALIARRWYDNEDVDAIFGMGHSAIALAVQQMAKEKNKINIVTSGGTSLLTGPNCSPNGAHWTFDTYSLSAATVMAAIDRGDKTFYFVTADYALGHAIQNDTTQLIEKAGGKVLGSVRHPLGTPDLSSFIMQAQASKAKVVVFANAGADFVNSVKTARDFGLISGGQRIAGTTVFLQDIPAMGLDLAQGMIVSAAYYWDQNEKTREFAERFNKRHGTPPSEMHAATYSGVLHYLKAVQAAGTDEARAVMAKIKEMPVNDFMTSNAKVREDGRLLRDMYILEVKKPEESKGKWDVIKVVSTVPASAAWRPLEEGKCPMISK